MKHRLYARSAVAERVRLTGTTARLLRFSDAVGSAAWGFEHVCTSFEDPAERDGVFVKVPAPRLTNHTITRDADGVTVRASIACPDCGTHGFVTGSHWTKA